MIGEDSDERAGRPRPINGTEEPLSTLREKAERYELPVHGKRIQLVSRKIDL